MGRVRLADAGWCMYSERSFLLAFTLCIDLPQAACDSGRVCIPRKFQRASITCIFFRANASRVARHICSFLLHSKAASALLPWHAKHKIFEPALVLTLSPSNHFHPNLNNEEHDNHDGEETYAGRCWHASSE